MDAFHLIVAALCMTLVATEVQGKPTTCARHYQSTLEFLLTLRETCDEATFKDCCQVRNAIYECKWMALSTIQS